MSVKISEWKNSYVKDNKAYVFYNGVFESTSCGRYIKASMQELKALAKSGRISDLTVTLTRI